MNTPLPPVKKGDRIELLNMPSDPDPIPTGSKGTVTYCNRVDLGRNQRFWQIDVAWDIIKRSLSIVIPPDRIRVIHD